MKYGSDNEFLEKCREVNFSAESVNCEKNLEALKGKLINRERFVMNRIRKIPIAAATIAIVLSLSVVALAATAWRYLDTRIIQGEEYVQNFVARESDDGTLEVRWELDPNASGPIVAEIEDGRVVIEDRNRSIFEDLDEALSILAIDNPMIPAYLPEGFAFDHAFFRDDPIKTPDHPTAAKELNIIYSFGQNILQFTIAERDGMVWDIEAERDGVDWDIDLEEIEVNGYHGLIGGNGLSLQVGNTMYFFSSMSMSYEQLIEIARSLQ